MPSTSPRKRNIASSQEPERPNGPRDMHTGFRPRASQEMTRPAPPTSTSHSPRPTHSRILPSMPESHATGNRFSALQESPSHTSLRSHRARSAAGNRPSLDSNGSVPAPVPAYSVLESDRAFSAHSSNFNDSPLSRDEKKNAYHIVSDEAPPAPLPQLNSARPHERMQVPFTQTSAANSATSSAANSRQPSPRVARRETEKKAIPLTKAGHLVLEIPAPTRYLDKCAEKRGREFTHIRYTAVTATADEFGKPESGYELRQRILARPTELFIVMTMYNEDERLFGKTLASVMRNISYMCSVSCPRSWGPNGWTNIVVCIVADGRSKIQRRVLDVLGLMGVYQDGIMKTTVGDKPVKAHLFEFTSQVCVDENLNILGLRDGIVPFLFCLKEKNGKKINSHRWFFNAFGPILDPNVCVLLDVGTKPTDTSIYQLWRAFDRTPDVGGACGEICAELGTGWTNLLNPLVAAQNFEYKMSNILDKPLESVFGYISVLPGAFSAYRYRALYDRSLTSGPLVSYFKGEAIHSGAADVFSANMYLAEDRILCFELFTKRNECWILKYVKNALAETDVPSTLPELVSQRRRWLNGSFFAAVHSITNYPLVFRSSHPFYRKFLFTLQTVYNFINLFFSWFSVGNFYLIFYILFNFGTRDISVDPFKGVGSILFVILNQLYLACLIAQFVCSFGNRPQGTKWIYYTIVVLFAIIMVFLMYVSVQSVVGSLMTAIQSTQFTEQIKQDSILLNIVIAMAGTYGLYFGASLLHLDPWHMLTSLLQYMLLLPTYVNVFMIYAFCNLHDISWGTKGDNTTQIVVLDAAQAAMQQPNKDTSDAPAIVNLDLPSENMADSNRAYDEMVADLQRESSKVTEPKRDVKTKTEDYFRLYRTRIVLFWLFCNIALIFVFTNPLVSTLVLGGSNTGASHPYLIFIFWSVTGLAGVRFLGCVFFILGWIMDGMEDLLVRGKVFDPYARYRNRRI